MYIRSIVFVSAISGSHAMFNNMRQRYQEDQTNIRNRFMSSRFENVQPDSMVLLDNMYYKISKNPKTRVLNDNEKIYQVQGVQTSLLYCLQVKLRTEANEHEIQQQMQVYENLKNFKTSKWRVTDIPHVQNLKYDGVDGDTAVFVMEDCFQPTLRERLESNVMSEVEAHTLLKQLSEGLKVLHRDQSKIILHDNLSPDNIMFTRYNKAKIAGFDHAKVLFTDEKIGTKAGNLHYMAPEILIKRMQHDDKADMWSIGVMLYEALTGQNPFGYAENDLEEIIIKSAIWSRIKNAASIFKE